MIRLICGLLLLTLAFGQMRAQSTAFVFNGGLSVGFQKWDNSFDRQPLYKYHAALTIESVNNENDNGSVFAQFGYHIRGSATRFRFFSSGGGNDIDFSEEFQFRNLSLLLGAKQKHPLGEKNKYFYYGGIRGDYTLNTNIDELAINNPYALRYYPFIGSMKRWMIGVSLGGGLEVPFSDLIGGQLTLSVHPDFTYQYQQPSYSGTGPDPYTGTITAFSIPERRIRNITIELSLGLRLLRKVVYEE